MTLDVKPTLKEQVGKYLITVIVTDDDSAMTGEELSDEFEFTLTVKEVVVWTPPAFEKPKPNIEYNVTTEEPPTG